MTPEHPLDLRVPGTQAAVDAVSPAAPSAGTLSRHALNNILARIIALAEDLADHDDVGVAQTGEAVIEQAELAARLLRGET